MSIGATGSRMIRLGITGTLGGTPATKALCVVAYTAAMKTDSLAVGAPKFVLIPFVRSLPGNRFTLVVRKVEQPHSIWQTTILMAKQYEISVVWIHMDMV